MIIVHIKVSGLQSRDHVGRNTQFNSYPAINRMMVKRSGKKRKKDKKKTESEKKNKRKKGKR